MTFKRLAAATLCAASLLAVNPFAASARTNAPRRGRALTSACKLTLSAEPRKVTSGEAPALFGRLSCPKGGETSRQTVTIYAGASATLAPQSPALGTAVTATGGYYSFNPPAPSADTVYRATAANALSPGSLVRVAPQVTLNGPSEGKPLFTGVSNRVSFSGTVGAGLAGAVVVLQRESSTSFEEWRTIQRATVAPSGLYTFVHRFVIPGAANIRVTVRSDLQARRESGSSSPLSYVITQRENPQLTLNALSAGKASDPIVAGESLTLEGALAGGANKGVSLLARNPLGQWSTAATQTAGTGGQYKFAVSPTESTFYRVLSSSGLHSSVLFEGVKSVLTATPSATTLQEGQTLTFSGSVAPSNVSHQIYLERENTPGSGPFHVVAVAALAAAHPGEAASYTLTRTVFGAGKQVYRVKVPGDRVNQGTSSAPVTIEVTPAPAAALGAPAPGANRF